MKSYERKLVLAGLYTLAFSAILGLLAVLLIGELPSTQQTAQWAERVSAGTYTLSYYLLIYAYLIPIMGFWAIHRLFAQEKRFYLLSFWGMILSILGSALPMASIGVTAFGYPALARMFLAHGLDIVSLIKDILNSNTMIFLLFSGLFYLTGIVLFGIVLWRNSGVLLKVASISIILHGILIIMPDKLFLNLLSWGFLLASSILLIIHARRTSTES
jgi:hypothetical protein